MLSLTDFLLQRIAEDESLARAGISSQADPENGWGYGGYGSPTALTPHVGIIHERVQAEHIIRWHPARVTAECEAKRRILDLHAVVPLANSAPWCEMCDSAAMDYPCPTLRALASVYAEHPDYDDAWRSA